MKMKRMMGKALLASRGGGDSRTKSSESLNSPQCKSRMNGSHDDDVRGSTSSLSVVRESVTQDNDAPAHSNGACAAPIHHNSRRSLQDALRSGASSIKGTLGKRRKEKAVSLMQSVS